MDQRAGGCCFAAAARNYQSCLSSQSFRSLARQESRNESMAAITCPSSRFYVQADWICKHWPTYQYESIPSSSSQLH